MKTKTRMKRPDVNSGVVIAKLLDCEGFSDFTANQIKRYWLKNCQNPRLAPRVAKIRRAFAEMVRAKLSDADRLILGRMMAVHARQNFDTGLRIGLTAFLNGARIDDEADSPAE